MSKLNTMEKLVLEILETRPAARKDDCILMWSVCQKLNPVLLSMTFGDVIFFHEHYNMPNWETVTRCRRKIQEKRPDLVNPEKAKIRAEEEQVYREYAKC